MPFACQIVTKIAGWDTVEVNMARADMRAHIHLHIVQRFPIPFALPTEPFACQVGTKTGPEAAKGIEKEAGRQLSLPCQCRE